MNKDDYESGKATSTMKNNWNQYHKTMNMMMKKIQEQTKYQIEMMRKMKMKNNTLNQ